MNTNYEKKEKHTIEEQSTIEKIDKILCQVYEIVESLEDKRFIHGPKIFQTAPNQTQHLKNTLKRLQKSLSLSDSVINYAFILMDKYTSSRNFFITQMNVYRQSQRLFITAIIISEKMNEDLVNDLYQYSQITKIEIKQLVQLENQMFIGMNEQTFLSEEEYYNFLQEMDSSFQMSNQNLSTTDEDEDE